MQLHEQYKDDVVCMTLVVDYQGFEDTPPESSLKPAEAILKKIGATFQSFVSSDEDAVVLERAGVSYIPAVLVYDQAGTVHPFTGGDAYEDDVFPLVEQLLTSTP